MYAIGAAVWNCGAAAMEGCASAMATSGATISFFMGYSVSKRAVRGQDVMQVIAAPGDRVTYPLRANSA